MHKLGNLLNPRDGMKGNNSARSDSLTATLACNGRSDEADLSGGGREQRYEW